jgi:hypothetical protein
MGPRKFGERIWTFAGSLMKTINPIGGTEMILLSNHVFPSRINLRASNPVRGDMFIEVGTTRHISSSARSDT